MPYLRLRDCIHDLEQRGQLVRIHAPINPDQEAGILQRRVFQAGGPALLLKNVQGTPFPMLANLFGTRERIRYLFRDTLARVESVLKAKADPASLFRQPLRAPSLLRAALHTKPRFVRTGPILARTTTLSKLPALVSWPGDGGAYVTLPQVYSEDPAAPGIMGSNLGMYRIQLTGKPFAADKEAGLHYQIHRGIGSHHASALERGRPLRVHVFIGGPPAMTVAAVMPLPEGLPEILFAGMLGGHRLPLVRYKGLPIPAEADFCIVGRVDPGRILPEGPFGDHLGYYSLAHDFPVLTVEQVFHRSDAVWPFTTVGRPPQEDTVFGEFIHELVGPLVPTVYHGVHQVHAVDAAGVHPLLLAVGSERYVPFAPERQPQELLTCAWSLLGSTQTSLSKYLFIAAREDAPELSAENIPAFFMHMLERMDFSRDIHFITRTTMDTLDYSGISLNQGSKAVFAAAGEKKRMLRDNLHALPSLPPLPWNAPAPRLFAPGILLIQAPPHVGPRDASSPLLRQAAKAFTAGESVSGIALIVLVDDVAFTAASWKNFLWVTFTRSDPATDIDGVGAFTRCKHWGCAGPLLIDARLKSYHPAVLTEDPDAVGRVESMAARGGPLHGLF